MSKPAHSSSQASTKGGVDRKLAAKTPADDRSAEDVALVYGHTTDGTGLNVLRKRRDRVEAGVLRPLEHGKPIDGDVVQLHQRGDSPLFDVEVHVAGQRSLPRKRSDASAVDVTKGPPQVASSDYRKGWDLIYRSKTNAKKLLN